MLKRLFKSKKAQNTAEYAILISLVVAGIVAMQTYAQRALQARVKDSSGMLSSVDGGADAGFGAKSGGWADGSSTATFSNVAQYEPYYSKQSYDINRTDTETKRLDNGFSGTSDSKRTRGTGGYQKTGWGTDGTTDYDVTDEKWK